MYCAREYSYFDRNHAGAVRGKIGAELRKRGPWTLKPTDPQSENESGVPRRDDRNPRGAARAEAARIGLAATPSAAWQRRGSRSRLGWLRWTLLVPVLAFTAWTVAGILKHSLNGSLATEEARYGIESPQASGAASGRAGAAVPKNAPARKDESGDPQEKPWNDPAKWTDGFGDGTPDFLRLTGEADRQAFRRWFVLIADYQAMRPVAQVPKEIVDCASLLRYAYREALKKHDAGWMKDTGMEVAALPGEIGAWHYPETPLGAGLFRVTPGPFERGDESGGAFAQFADAKTLMDRNTYLVSRNVWQAEPGDLLFYRQFGQLSPWHSMIVTRVGADAAVVYDTGEDHGAPGELRRVELTELLGHPEPQWRPLASNPNFMGVYRWNILRGSS